MAELTTKLVRDYFAGRWLGEVFINGEQIHELEFKWTEKAGKFSVPHINLEYWFFTESGVKEEKNNHIIVTWRSDKHSWINMWYNESGGYSEQQWTSQDKVNGVTVLYGSLRERAADGGLPTEHIAMCELNDQNNFKYTILSYRKGILEMVAKRICMDDDLITLIEKQAEKANS